MERGAEFGRWLNQLIDDFIPPQWQGIGALGPEERSEMARRWRAVLAEHGLLAPTWPSEYGGASLSVVELATLFETVRRRGLTLWSDVDAVGVSLIGNSILGRGTDEQKARFLPKILSGEHVWCQGFSEPGAGSDLAAIQTRAVERDGTWVVNGQKIWSSSAARANWIFLLARTEMDVPGHRGITMLLMPMNQPGIEVRPIRNLRGDDEFCEVFFTDAVTDSDLTLGGRGRGWAVTMTLLGYERGETALYVPVEFEVELQRLIDLARVRGMIEQPDVRQRLADLHVRVETLKALGSRELGRMASGIEPGPEAGGFKVLYTEYHQSASELAVDLLGADALTMEGAASASWLRTDDPGSPHSSRSWLEIYLNARAGSIYAGTNQIQRNIVGEMVLGLPKEPRL